MAGYKVTPKEPAGDKKLMDLVRKFAVTVAKRDAAAKPKAYKETPSNVAGVATDAVTPRAPSSRDLAPSRSSQSGAGGGVGNLMGMSLAGANRNSEPGGTVNLLDLVRKAGLPAGKPQTMSPLNPFAGKSGPAGGGLNPFNGKSGGPQIRTVDDLIAFLTNAQGLNQATPMGSAPGLPTFDVDASMAPFQQERANLLQRYGAAQDSYRQLQAGRGSLSAANAAAANESFGANRTELLQTDRSGQAQVSQDAASAAQALADAGVTGSAASVAQAGQEAIQDITGAAQYRMGADAKAIAADDLRRQLDAKASDAAFGQQARANYDQGVTSLSQQELQQRQEMEMQNAQIGAQNQASQIEFANAQLAQEQQRLDMADQLRSQVMQQIESNPNKFYNYGQRDSIMSELQGWDRKYGAGAQGDDILAEVFAANPADAQSAMAMVDAGMRRHDVKNGKAPSAVGRKTLLDVVNRYFQTDQSLNQNAVAELMRLMGM